MISETSSLIGLTAAWTAYFTLHSVLASLTIKRSIAARFPALMPAYRIGFNAIATLTVLPIIWLLYNNPGPFVWARSGAWRYLANGLGLTAAVGFLLTLRDHDGSEFLGFRQWCSQTRTVEDQECFHLSALHRFVRHPW